MTGLFTYRFRRTTLLLVGCIAFLVGIGGARGGYLLSPQWCLIFLLPALLSLRLRTLQAIIVVSLFGLSLGWWRGSLYIRKLAVYDGLFYHQVDLRVTATEDAVYGAHTQLTFTADNIVNTYNGQQLAGKISLSGFGLNAVFQGDRVEAAGKLYPTLGTNQSRLSFATLTMVSHRPSAVASIRRQFSSGMQTALPEPLASFAMGLLIGQRASLPDNVKQDLLMVGLTHIIAVSGYNLTIILEASHKILGRRSKRLSTWLSLALIGVFLLLAGTSASIVRAAIISVLGLATDYYGRRVKPLLLIAMAAAITTYANPFYVWSDSSWYLSFLAFYGVLVLSPIIASRCRLRWQHSLIFQVALESICAELMTLPFILFTFGQMSFVGLPANILVTTLVPLAMLLSTVAGLAGMAASDVCGWFAWPARMLLTYMLDVAHLLSRLPHVFVQNLALSVLEMIALYLLLIFITVAVWFKTKSESAIITDRE